MSKSNNSDVKEPYVIHVKETPKVSSGQIIDLPSRASSLGRRTTMAPKSSFAARKNMLNVKVEKCRKMSKANEKSNKMTLNLPDEPKKRKKSSILPMRYESFYDV